MEKVNLKSYYFNYNDIILKLSSYYEKMIKLLEKSNENLTLKFFGQEQDNHFEEFIKDSEEILLKSIEKVF